MKKVLGWGPVFKNIHLNLGSAFESMINGYHKLEKI